MGNSGQGEGNYILVKGIFAGGFAGNDWRLIDKHGFAHFRRLKA